VSGTVVSITPGQTIQIGAEPILLENMNPPANTTTPPPVSNATFTYEGLSNDFANMATENPSSPEVPPSSNQAPTGTPVAGEVALSNLLVMPGLSAPTTGTATVDSDATLAVGTTQIMQWADFRLQVYNKTATPLLNAMPGNVLWSSTLMDGTSNPCASAVGADGIVQFDKLASVWVLAMRTGNNQECIGISQSSDATQQYYQYLFSYVDPNNPTYQMDYPHIGVWPDAYYLTFDMLDPSNDYAPQYAVACALNRPSMVFGRPNAGAVCFTTAYSNNTGFFHLIPSDLDSTALPPTGSPNYIFTFAKPASSTAYHLYGYQFHVNFSTPSESTFTGPVQIDTNAFSGFVPACAAGGDNCVPQPPAPAGMTDYDLDSLGGYLMYRAAYRNFGSYESLLLSQAVQTGKGTGVQYPVGVRWYELRNLQAGPTIYQNGFLQAANSSTTPDTFNRWMSSAAEDGMGNIAVGYSISGAGPTAYYSGYPGLAINGRVPSDPLGTFETEKIVFPGVSVEVPTPPLHTGRWGSVATLAIDPVDQCTFWFTGQYEPTPGVLWSTELVSFTMPGCPQ
jgi:hypothetical protein